VVDAKEKRTGAVRMAAPYRVTLPCQLANWPVLDEGNVAEVVLTAAMACVVTVLPSSFFRAGLAGSTCDCEMPTVDAYANGATWAEAGPGARRKSKAASRHFSATAVPLPQHTSAFASRQAGGAR